MSKAPSEYARWVREVHQVPLSGAVDLERLVTLCGGRIEEMDLVGCSGTLLPLNGTFGIAVRESDSRPRKRFTVAHELGHFCIPSHKKHAVHCVSPELSREGSVRAAEREANAFAAELLMPRETIQAMVETGAIDMSRALEVAEAFDVSTLSAALRVSEITRERSAVVYFQDGRIRWAFRSGMPYGLPPTGASPPGSTIAWDIECGRPGSPTAQEVDAGAWLPFGRPDPSWGSLLESSVRVDGSGDILTVLWLTFR
jgi:IrrE N-terminal-like domain